MPETELGQTLKVVNVSPSKLRLMWNSRTYTLGEVGSVDASGQPANVAYLMFDCVKLYFGDPRATSMMRSLRDTYGTISFLPDRASEVRRLRLLYNAPFGEYVSSTDGGQGSIFLPDDAPIHAVGNNPAFANVRVPHVEVYDMTGARIYTVLDDPEGLDTIPVPVTAAKLNETDLLRSQLASQGALLAAIANKMGLSPEALMNQDITEMAGIETEPSDPDPQPEPLVYDPQSDEVKARKPRRPVEVPSGLNELPEDKI